MLITGVGEWSPERTIIRLETIAALRSGSSSTRSESASCGERHLDQPDGAVDHRLAGGEDRFGLLAAEHDLGDLGRVGEVGEPGLEHLDPGGLRGGPGARLGALVRTSSVLPRSEIAFGP